MDELFKRVMSYLKCLGIIPKLIKLPPIDTLTIRKVEQKLALTIPVKLLDLYLHYGSGIVFCWFQGGDFGSLNIPTPKDLVKQYRGWKETVLWIDDYDFPHVKNRLWAKKTYQRMKYWMPLIGEGNGDGFCLDCGSRDGTVVFHKHDWFDGGSGENGHVIAPNLKSFIEDWAQVCFTRPKRLYWPATFVRKGVSWTGRHFKKDYIIRK